MKIAIMHGKGEFSKIKGKVCSIPIEASNICNILPRSTVLNGLIVAKLKWDLKLLQTCLATNYIPSACLFEIS